MTYDVEIFKWIKNVGAEKLSLDPSYKSSREMFTHIFQVHKHLFFMRKIRGYDTDGYLYHMIRCQDALARIEFLCAIRGLDTHAPDLAKIFVKMSDHERTTYRISRSSDSVSKL